MDMDILDVSLASFWGEDDGDYSGYSVSDAGDVNGDGFDDVLIGAYGNEDCGSDAGKTYLVLGKNSDWLMDMDLSLADASFRGEDVDDFSGCSVSGAGDVNGDGFDDILIGASYDEDGGSYAGQTYLIFGKASGWSKDVDLSLVDSSFHGEDANDQSGCSVSGAGDVNGDGYDDILIGAYGDEEGGSSAGQTYMIFGKPSGWSLHTDLSSADASFWGEDANDQSGCSVSGAGDVNGDGYDDILIGAWSDSDGGSGIGQTYLIFGGASGWSMDTDLSLADASFWGEDVDDSSGWSVSGAGDVNGDGFDDILIGAYGNDDGGLYSGQTYLIKGKASGWSMDMDLSLADASFWGEDDYDDSGRSVSGAGDVNGDGFDDFIIGAYYDEDGGSAAGQTYMIFGKASGWSMDTDLSSIDASFLGENANDWLGYSVSEAGDVNGDGFDDILIGAYNDDDGGSDAGQTYLIPGMALSEPLAIYDIRVTDGNGDKIKAVDIGETVHIEILGLDNNSTRIDGARVNITFSLSEPRKITLSLIETGMNTGIYKGIFTVRNRAEYFERISFSAYIDPSKKYEIIVDYPYRPSSVSSISVLETASSSIETDYIDIGQVAYIKAIGIDSNPIMIDKAFVNLTSDRNSSFKEVVVLTETEKNTGVYIGTYVVPFWMEYFENITIRSVETNFIWTKFMVLTPLQIRGDSEITLAIEDVEYREFFWNFGFETAVWTITESAEWLEWDNSKKELFGTPDNFEVGVWSVMIRITDVKGHNDTLNFDIEVENRPPLIITEDLLTANEDEDYYVDYNSDDDGQGEVAWFLSTDAPFLSLDRLTGIMSGHPIDEDIGTYVVSIEVQDGNGGIGKHSFNLTVLMVNERPIIITNDVKTIMQDDTYVRDYDALDPDIGDTQMWMLLTDATWMRMNISSGVLSGTPLAQHVGMYTVNITVFDSGKLSDSHQFQLEVLNRKDTPFFTDVPNDTAVFHGNLFRYDVNATDYDLLDKLEFSIFSDPESNISINPETGVIDWYASVKWLRSGSDGLIITLKVSDGELFSTHSFKLVIKPTLPPSSTLFSPVKGAKTPSTYSFLTWEGNDPEGDPITYSLYVSDSEAFVSENRNEALISVQITDQNYTLTGLTVGKTYYWTVIPSDGGAIGECTSGIFSFKVNNPPSILSIDRKQATIDKEFKLRVVGEDIDPEDSGSLKYSLVSTIPGMNIDTNTGMITWTPKDDQTGEKIVRVRVSDEIEASDTVFYIDVSGSKGFEISSLMMVGAVVLILIIIVIIVFFVLKKKREKQAVLDEERADEVAEEIEQHKRELEWEKAHYRKGESNVISDVPISPAEAHHHDHDGKQKSHKELYGERVIEE